MTNSLRSTFYLLAPCLALGTFAFYLSRRPQPPPPPILYGPLHFSVQGVESQNLLPINVYNGYDRRFQIVWQASGARPKWWGQSALGSSGTDIKGWKFWLEHDGKRTPFKPTKTLLWTTDWDKSKKRYYNAFSLHCGKIPTNASLKVSGSTRLDLSMSPTPYKSSTIPFEVTLKKAGEPWPAAQVSTDPRMAIRKIEIRRPHGGRTVAAVTVLSSPGTELNTYLGSAQVLTADWRFCPPPSGTFEISFGGDSGLIRKPSERIRVVEFQWSNAEIQKASQRDLLITGTYSNSNNWPLEITFAIKKNGKSLFGVVPPLTRPSAKQKH